MQKLWGKDSNLELISFLFTWKVHYNNCLPNIYPCLVFLKETVESLLTFFTKSAYYSNANKKI